MEENIGDTRFHVKVNQMEEENSILREEIVKLDDKNLFLERINACLKRQLEEDHKRYDELQREYDKLKVVFDEVTEKEKIGNVALKKSRAEKQILITKIEAAELEAEEISSLREKLKKATSEKTKFSKRLVEITKTLDEEYNKYEVLQKVVKELQEANEHLQKICESRENTIQVLRETSRELADENAELKLLIDRNACHSIDRDSTLPNSDSESYYIHGTTSCESNGMAHQVSLFDELKASGFSNTHERDDAINHQLENQVHWYELEINKLLQQTERVFEQLVSIYGEERFRLCVTQNPDYTECSEKAQNFETLKRRIQVLLDVSTETPSTIANIGIEHQLGTDSKATGKLNKVFKPRNNLEHALNIDNGTTYASTVNQNIREDAAPLLFAIFAHKDKSFTLPVGPAIIRESSQGLAEGRKDSKRKNKAISERNLKWRGNVSRSRSKSESSLITEKKHSSFLHRSFNIVTTPLSLEKVGEGVGPREKAISDSTSKGRERKDFEETKELKGVQNLTSWYEYKFGGTYRSLNNSTDSSICSTSSRHSSLLGLEDSSLNEPCQRQQCESCPVYLAPTRLKPPPNKMPSFFEEKCVNGTHKSCESTDSSSGFKLSTADSYDKRSMSPFRRFSNCDIYQSLAVYSTPIHVVDLKDKNSRMHKNDTGQTAKTMRRSSCGSLIRQFVDLDISNETNDLFNMHNECHTDEVIYNEHLENVNFTDMQSIASTSSKGSSYESNAFQRNSRVFTKYKTPKECSISDEMQFFVTTVEETKGCTDAIRKGINETSPGYENNTNGFEKSVHGDLSDIGELQDILEKMENSREENNNVLQSNNLCTSSLMTSNDLLSNVCQNFNRKLTHSSKHEIVDSEKSTFAVSHTPTNLILIIPSWRIFISCSLLFILGYYLKDVIAPLITPVESPWMWYSYEEILNQYFPTRSKELPPL